MKTLRGIILSTVSALLITTASSFAALQEVSQFDTDGSALEVVVRGDYAYIADEDGLYIVDVSDAASPDSITKWNDPSGTLNTLVVDDNYVYAACGRDGMHIIDITNPASPTLVGEFSVRGAAISDVEIIGTYALATFGNRGLHIIDISTVSLPVDVASADPAGGTAQGVDIDGNYAYVAYGQAGLRIFDITDIINGTPENFDINDMVGEFDAAGESNNVMVDGRFSHRSGIHQRKYLNLGPCEQPVCNRQL